MTPPNPAIASEMREEDLPSGHNGRPVTIKITVEEVSSETDADALTGHNSPPDSVGR